MYFKYSINQGFAQRWRTGCFKNVFFINLYYVELSCYFSRSSFSLILQWVKECLLSWPLGKATECHKEKDAHFLVVTFKTKKMTSNHPSKISLSFPFSKIWVQISEIKEKNTNQITKVSKQINAPVRNNFLAQASLTIPSLLIAMFTLTKRISQVKLTVVLRLKRLGLFQGCSRYSEGTFWNEDTLATRRYDSRSGQNDKKIRHNHAVPAYKRSNGKHPVR